MASGAGYIWNEPAETMERGALRALQGERLRALAGAFSREDLLRSFDLVAKLEADIRLAPQPRYHLEMALLRWIHLRKLVPLTELLGGTPPGETRAAPPPVRRPSAKPLFG